MACAIVASSVLVHLKSVFKYYNVVSVVVCMYFSFETSKSANCSEEFVSGV